MAKGKKSFIAYADWKAVFDELPNEDAGALIKHIFAYVNDENPVSDSILLKAVFANIKSTLKRDLEKWENQLQQRIDAGKRSAEIRALNKSNEKSTVVDSRTRNSTDSVNVSVSVSDSVNEKVKKKKEFSIPTPQEITDYGILRGYKLDGRKLFDYYNDNDWKDKNDVKVKNWKQKILAVWCKEENKIKQEPNILKLNEIDDNTHYWVKFKGVQKYKNIGFGIKKEATYNQLEYIETI